MKSLIVEHNEKNATPFSSVYAAMDNRIRTEKAMEMYEDFFTSKSHMKRLQQVEKIILDFFNQYPNYYNPRFGHNIPFEAVKISDVGRFLRRMKTEEKNERLYRPLFKLGNVIPTMSNGHLIVRVYPE